MMYGCHNFIYITKRGMIIHYREEFFELSREKPPIAK